MKIKCSELNWTHIDQLMQGDEISQQDKNIINLYKETFQNDKNLSRAINIVFHDVIKTRIKERKIPFLFMVNDYINDLNKRIIDNKGLSAKDVELSFDIHENKIFINKYILIKEDKWKFLTTEKLIPEFYFVEGNKFFDDQNKDEYNIPFSLIIDAFKKEIINEEADKKIQKYRDSYDHKELNKYEDHKKLLYAPDVYIDLFWDNQSKNPKITKIKDKFVKEIEKRQKEKKRLFKKYGWYFDSISPVINRLKEFNEDIKTYGEEIVIKKIENSKSFQNEKEEYLIKNNIKPKTGYFENIESDIKKEGIFSWYLPIYKQISTEKEKIMNDPNIDYVLPLVLLPNEKEWKNFSSLFKRELSYVKEDNFKLEKMSEAEIIKNVWEKEDTGLNVINYMQQEKEEAIIKETEKIFVDKIKNM
ncbi:hypothetical protein ACXYRQ_01260 [Mycoplasma sp. 394]